MLLMWLGCNHDGVMWYRCEIIVIMVVLHVTGEAGL